MINLIEILDPKWEGKGSYQGPSQEEIEKRVEKISKKLFELTQISEEDPVKFIVTVTEEARKLVEICNGKE